MSSNKKGSYVPQGFPSDLPSVTEFASIQGEPPKVEKKGRVTVTTQGYNPPKYETVEERETRVKDVQKVEGKNSGRTILRKDF